jgi:hypothetical protein
MSESAQMLSKESVFVYMSGGSKRDENIVRDTGL